MSEFLDRDAILAQFNLLMGELLQGGKGRATFRPWEIDILLDIESCNMSSSAKRQVLGKYQTAVQAELQEGAQLPMRFSEYLERQEGSRRQRKPARGASHAPAKPKTKVR